MRHRLALAATLALALIVAVVTLARGDVAPMFTSSACGNLVQSQVAGHGWHSEQEPDQADGAGGWVRQDRITLQCQVPGAPDDPQRPATAGVLDIDLKPGDTNNVSGNAGYRAEVYDRFGATGTTNPALWPDPPGSTRRYTIPVYLWPDTALDMTAVKWGPIFAQLKGHWGGSPVRSLTIKRDRFYSDSAIAGRYDLGPVARGKWTTFRITETWSLDPAIGGVQIERNGAVIVPWKHLQTLETTSKGIDPVYLKVGAYASAAWSKAGTGFHVVFGDITVENVTPPA